MNLMWRFLTKGHLILINKNLWGDSFIVTGYTLPLFAPCHDDVIKWKHFPRYWPFVRGIHRSPVNFPHKGQWRGALVFSLICVWINGWVNQSWGWWFETLSRPLRRYCNVHRMVWGQLQIVHILIGIFVQLNHCRHECIMLYLTSVKSWPCFEIIVTISLTQDPVIFS